MQARNMRAAALAQDLSKSNLDPQALPDDVVEGRQAGKQAGGRQEPGLAVGHFCCF